MNQLQIRLISSLEQLVTGSFSESWSKFVSRLTGFSKLAFSDRWLVATEPAFTRNGETLFFVSVWRRDEIVAVAPFQLLSRGWGPCKFRQLQFWGMGGNYVEYPTVSLLTLPDVEMGAIEIIVEALSGELTEYFDEISLPRTDQENPFIKALCSIFYMASNVDLNEQVHLFGAHQHIDEKLKGENLRRIRRAERRMREEFTSFEMTVVKSVDDVLLEEIRMLHIHRQHEVIDQGRYRISFFEDPVENAVIRDMIRVAGECGALHVYLLRLEGKLVNFWICLTSDGYTMAWITAMQKVPGHKYAPSCVWLFMIREELDTCRTQWVDIGFGTSILKRKFSNTFIPLRSITLTNTYRWISRLRNDVMQNMRRIKRMFNRALSHYAR